MYTEQFRHGWNGRLANKEPHKRLSTPALKVWWAGWWAAYSAQDFGESPEAL